MIKKLNDRIFSKLTKDGYEIIHWIFSFLTLVFLVNLILGTIVSTLTNGYYIIDGSMIGRPFKEIFSMYILNFIDMVIVNLISFVFVLMIAKWSGKKINTRIDRKILLFSAGVYMFIMNLINLFSSCLRIIRIFIENHFNAYGYLNTIPLFFIIITILLPLAYLAIGAFFIKKSDYLSSELSESD